MKNLYLLLFASSTYCLTAQEYLPTTNPSHQWKVQFTIGYTLFEGCEGIGTEHKYFFGNEVEINGQTYFELYKRYSDGALETYQIMEDRCPEETYYISDLTGMTSLEDILVGYLRDDINEKKVYFLKSGETNETLLNDYSFPYGNNSSDDYLIQVSDAHAFGINTIKQKHSYQGTYYFDEFEGIGNVGDLIQKYYWETDIEGHGFKVLGFSTDNGDTFYDVNNNLLSTDDPSLNNSVKIYPNPVNDIINLQTEKKIKSATIYDLNGRKVKKSNSSNKISVRELNPATYIITLEFENGSAYRNKIIKN